MKNLPADGVINKCTVRSVWRARWSFQCCQFSISVGIFAFFFRECPSCKRGGQWWRWGDWVLWCHGGRTSLYHSNNWPQTAQVALVHFAKRQTIHDHGHIGQNMGKSVMTHVYAFHALGTSITTSWQISPYCSDVNFSITGRSAQRKKTDVWSDCTHTSQGTARHYTVPWTWLFSHNIAQRDISWIG